MANPNVLVFDETQEQYYLRLLCRGVKDGGGVAIPFNDLDIALEEFGDSVGALVATASPLLSRAERLEQVVATPLLHRAFELGVPLALVSEHPAVRVLTRPEELDIVVPSNMRELGQLPSRISRWLISISQGKKPDIEERQQPEVTRSSIVGTNIFGSEVKMRIAMWIASREIVEGDFYQLQVIQALGLSASGVASSLKKLCNAGMLQRDSDGWRVYYRRLDSPLWGIFDIVENELKDQGST